MQPGDSRCRAPPAGTADWRDRARSCAETVDLHVDRALVDGAAAGERRARHGLARAGRKDAQHLALAVGQVNDLVAQAQFAALKMKDVGPERDLLQRLHRRRRGALQNIADAQHQFARFERLCDIVVGADLQALDPGFRLMARGQHDDRHGRGGADEARQVKTAFAGHHHVEDQQVEMQAEQFCARVAGAHCGGDAIAFAGQEARQQIADAPVVVDQKQMRRVVGRVRRASRSGRGDRCCICLSATITPLASAADSKDRFQHLVGIVAIDHRAQELAHGFDAGRVDVAHERALMRSVCSPASFATKASPLAVAYSRR